MAVAGAARGGSASVSEGMKLGNVTYVEGRAGGGNGGGGGGGFLGLGNLFSATVAATASKSQQDFSRSMSRAMAQHDQISAGFELVFALHHLRNCRWRPEHYFGERARIAGNHRKCLLFGGHNCGNAGNEGSIFGIFQKQCRGKCDRRTVFRRSYYRIQNSTPSDKVRQRESNDQQGLQLPQIYFNAAERRSKFVMKNVCLRRKARSNEAAYRQVFEATLARIQPKHF